MKDENKNRLKRLNEAEQTLQQSRTVLDYLEEAGADVKQNRSKVEKLKRAVAAAKTALKTLPE